MDTQDRLRTIIRMDTHYHIWYYQRDSERTIRSMERDDTVYTTRRKAGQVLQCVDGAFRKPMPEEMVDRGVPFGPKYAALEQLADQARSIRPALKHVRAMRQREELDAAGRTRSPQEVRAELTERQAEVDAELTQLLQDVPRETTNETG